MKHYVGLDVSLEETFICVLDENGDEVYSAEKADATAVAERGTVFFATSDQSSDELLNLYENEFEYIASVSDGTLFEWDGTPLMLAQADLSKPKKKRRKKKRAFILTSATDAAGLQHADIVISKKDALALAASKDARAVLKNARVIILVDKSIGGIEGRLLSIETLMASLLTIE